MDTLAQVRTIPDPVERVAAINTAIENTAANRNSEIAELSAIKRETVAQLVAEHGGAEAARMLGVTRGRVSQIVNGRRAK